MKRTVLLLFALSLTGSLAAQNEGDSLKIQRLEREINTLKSNNENLSSSLELTNQALNDLIKDKRVSDETRWTALRSSILHTTQVYKKLSDDIINLKSRMTDQDYQGFINSLGSIEGGPLGFSFEEVIKESVNRIGIFETKSKMDRFLEITNSVISSPIASGMPFVSQAVFASNSLLNITYSSLMGEKKPDFKKINKFETELNRYLTYFSALDRANAANQSSNNDRILLLENLQLELMARLRKEAPKLGYSVPERWANETIDAYFNRVLGNFSYEYVQFYLNRIENRHKNTRGEINYSNLLQNEPDLKNFSNQMGSLADLSKKFILYYDNFFEIADSYHNRIMEAVELANTNGIIKGRKVNGVEETPKQVYEKISKNLKDKKANRDNGIKDSINISDLKQKIEKIEEFRAF